MTEKKRIRCKWKEAERVASLVNAVPGQCFTNCYRVIKKVSEYGGAMLVRGKVFFQDDDEPIDHVWIERGGWIIDPTVVLIRERGERYSYLAERRCQKLPRVARLGEWLIPVDRTFYR